MALAKASSKPDQSTSPIEMALATLISASAQIANDHTKSPSRPGYDVRLTGRSDYPHRVPSAKGLPDA